MSVSHFSSFRMPGLDGIRALAVIAVVWHHTHPGLAGLPMTRNGFLGVDVFFVLSGFLITTLLLREREGTGRISLKNFYIRRSLRIFPLYYAVLALLCGYFLVAGQGAAQGSQFFRELPYHLTYTSNWVEMDTMMAITWSLSTEEQFYLLWPPLLALLPFGPVPLLLGLLALNQAINFGWLDGTLASLGIPYGRHEILQSTFTPILLGVLLAFAMGTARGLAILKKGFTGIGLPVAVAALLLVANLPGDIRGWPRLSVHLLTTGVIAGVVLQPGHVLVRVLEVRPLVHVGVVSYGVYLLHMLVREPVRRVMERAGIDQPMVFFLLCLVLTVVLSGLSFRYFERPLLRFKDRFR